MKTPSAIHKKLKKSISANQKSGWETASLLWLMWSTGGWAAFETSWYGYIESRLGLSMQWASKMTRIWELYYVGKFKGKWNKKHRLSVTKMEIIARFSTPDTVGKNLDEAFEKKTTVHDLEIQVLKLRSEGVLPSDPRRTIAIHMTKSDYNIIMPKWVAFKDANFVTTNSDAFKLLLKKAKL